jgi:antitoxin VapB
MQTAKVFSNGRSQTVRLPKEFRFDSDEVYVARMGSAVVLMPKVLSWNVLFESLDGFSDDFMAERLRPNQRETNSSIAP